MATISVLVPTYKRVESLHRCLKALSEQQRACHEVLVVVRDADAETGAYLAGKGPEQKMQQDSGEITVQRLAPPPNLSLRQIPVSGKGVVAAMNAGLAAAKGEIVALTDDDAAPHWDWLERIHGAFAQDPKIGGVGGRDYVYFGERLDGAGYETDNVGRLLWFGLVIANHHLGKGEARDVALLKGVNCAYRTAAIKPLGFDTRLRGEGAQVHWELMLGLNLLHRGWRLVYDPAIAVDHFPSIRHDKDQRGVFQADTHYDIVYNETLALSENLTGMHRLAFLTWAALVGTRFAPGLLQYGRLKLLAAPEARNDASARFRATWAGRRAGKAAAQPSAARAGAIAEQGARTV